MARTLDECFFLSGPQGVLGESFAPLDREEARYVLEIEVAA
jgi:hypothetical protein